MTTVKPESFDGVPVICESCGTVSLMSDTDEADNITKNHNENLHDGEEVAFSVTSKTDVNLTQLTDLSVNKLRRWLER